MKKILKPILNIMLRGALYLIPILVALVVIDKIYEKLKQIIVPIENMLPGHALLGIGKKYWVACMLLISIGLVMGFISKTTSGMKFLNWLEDHFLSLIPGYTFLKHRREAMMDPDDVTKGFKVVLFNTDEDVWQMAYVIEEAGDMLTLYVPTVPNAGEGDLFYTKKHKIRNTNITYRESIKIMRSHGTGSLPYLKDVL